MLAVDDKGKVYTWGRMQALAGQPLKDRFNNIFDYENFGVDELTPR